MAKNIILFNINDNMILPSTSENNYQYMPYCVQYFNLYQFELFPCCKNMLNCKLNLKTINN